jgi:hypothetical protein
LPEAARDIAQTITEGYLCKEPFSSACPDWAILSRAGPQHGLSSGGTNKFLGIMKTNNVFKTVYMKRVQEMGILFFDSNHKRSLVNRKGQSIP